MMKNLAVTVACAAAATAQQGWYPHEGGLLKYRVNIRFGEEPDTMPAGWKFGRVSAAAVDANGDVYVFQRGARADPLIVFDENATYDTLAGRIMRIDIATGKILGAMESPGHWITLSPAGEIFIASLTGNVFRWYPGWIDRN